jgi:hypothetical protein
VGLGGLGRRACSWGEHIDPTDSALLSFDRMKVGSKNASLVLALPKPSSFLTGFTGSNRMKIWLRRAHAFQAERLSAGARPTPGAFLLQQGRNILFIL